MATTNDKHFFNCPDAESGSFIQNLRGFSEMLDFLENAIYNTKAIFDYDNLKEYESYNTAKYKSNNIYAKNKCLSERIRAIYTKDWLSILSKDTQEAYNDDIHIFMEQWRKTFQENHQNIQSFVASFCKKVGCNPMVIDEQISNYTQFQFDIANTKIMVRRGAAPLNTQALLLNSYLLPSIRQWYIVSHSQYNSFNVLLRSYMRYIEINIRYFYVYDTSSGHFDKQPCRRDIHALRQI